MITVDEADYASILSQVKNQEFAAEVAEREKQIRAQLKAEEQLVTQESQLKYEKSLADKASELQQKQTEIAQLQAQLQSIEKIKDAERKNAILEEQQRLQSELNSKDAQIQRLQADAVLSASQTKEREAAIEARHAQEMKAQQELVEFYKNFKLQLSTKMLGETLEQHCAILFEQSLRPLMPKAYFEKDNDASKGTKGDYIFRDSVGEHEYISIMFDMKNEADATEKKKHNVDFLAKLDEDRRKKGCEYAVLVSMLEPESELYNQGIVDVSHKYEKMFVVRPQHFVNIIMLLVNANKKSISLQQELAIARNQSLDVTNFESKLTDFKEKFGNNYRIASEKFNKAIDEIDKSIEHLNRIKEALLGSDRHLRLANDRA